MRAAPTPETSRIEYLFERTLPAGKFQMINRYRDVVFLVGAGVSIAPPSGFPPAAPLTEVLLRWVAADARSYSRLHDRALGTRATTFDFLRFELLFEQIVHHDPKIFDVLEVLQYEGMPNKFHYFLALALQRGSRVLTTNFDTRIEEAARILGISAPRLVVGPAPQMQFQQRYRLVKLHGSFADTTDPARNVAPKPAAALSHIGKTGLMFRRLQPFQRQCSPRLRTRRLSFSGIPRRTASTWFHSSKPLDFGECSGMYIRQNRGCGSKRLDRGTSDSSSKGKRRAMK